MKKITKLATTTMMTGLFLASSALAGATVSGGRSATVSGGIVSDIFELAARLIATVSGG